jgi:carboxypeptidase C (cathepsin A)
METLEKMKEVLDKYLEKGDISSAEKEVKIFMQHFREDRKLRELEEKSYLIELVESYSKQNQPSIAETLLEELSFGHMLSDEEKIKLLKEVGEAYVKIENLNSAEQIAKKLYESPIISLFRRLDPRLYAMELYTKISQVYDRKAETSECKRIMELIDEIAKEIIEEYEESFHEP